jgi:hypothetical protein
LSNNEFKNADQELNKLLEIYSDNLQFSYNDNQINQKLVLVYTLKGYTNSELKNYDKAIENYLKKKTTKKFKSISLRFATACGASPNLRLDLVLNDFVFSALTQKKISLNSRAYY